MAQLNSLIVTGAARFLNKLYAKDLLVSDSFTTEGTIDVGHSTPVNALIYLNGKEAFDGHDSWLRINKTKAFTSGVYFGSSLIRTDAGIQVLSNGTALNATGTSFKVGVPATFADLNADYVYANTLSTSHFDLQEINQIGDNSTFYVAPSIKFPASTTTQIAITKNASNVTIAISDSSITSTTIAGAIWTAGSKVKASGTLDGIVTGTMDGTVSSLNTSSHVLTIQVSGGNWESLTTKTITDRTAINNFNVMMYERYADSKFYPVGIVLTSYGGSGKLTYMDIFAGTSGNDSLPNVRLGNLSSIGQITYATGVTATPTGYGLYADNVYLKGVIVADSGMVGGFQLSSNSIHTANVAITSNADNSIGLSAANFTRTVAGASRTNLRFALGKNFGVSNTGQIFSSSGEIGGWTITSTALYKNTNSTTSTTAGIYLGTDGIRNYKDADTFVNIKDGVITAKAVDLTGKITATSGDIGSIHIGTSSLYSGSHTAYNSNVAGFYLGSDGKLGIGNNSSYLRYDGTNVSLSVQSLSIGGVSAATEDSVKAATETIIGTQTAATGSWTGKSDYISALSDGLQIKYWLPYAGSGNATLNLTLSGGGTTGAIAIYRQGGTYNTTSKAVVANRVTTHFPAGSMINMTYGVNRTVAVVYSGTTYTGTFTGWFADGAYDSGNTINRTRFESAIKAVTAITAGHIICGNSSGYKNIAKGLAFDLSYPLLYARSAINANATGTNNDTLASNINFSTSLAITSGAANKELYLMGDVDGSTFTIDSSTPLTTVVPSSANGKYYIPLGVMSSATYGTFVSSNRLYAYVNGSFQAVDVAARITADNALTLETPYTYSDDNVVFTAVLYRGGEDVSTEYLSDCYKWYKKTEDGLTLLSVGYTFTINKSELEYGGSIVCRFNTDTTIAALSTPSNSVLTDINGSYLTTYISTDEFLANLGDPATTNVAGLPTKTAANITGSLLGTTTDAAYRIDYNELAKAIIENYNSSTLLGETQSLKNAFADIESNYCRVYKTVTEIGLTTGTDIATVWTALPDGSSLVADYTEIANPPENYGMYDIYRMNTSRGHIMYISKDYGNIYIMPLTSDNKPSGTWNKIVNENGTILNAQNLVVPKDGAYYTNSWGNFVHNSTTATNSFNICNNSGTSTFCVYYEDGSIYSGVNKKMLVASPNNSVTGIDWIGGGVISGNSKSVSFTIPFNTSANSATITKMSLALRTIAGNYPYMCYGSSNNQYQQLVYNTSIWANSKTVQTNGVASIKTWIDYNALRIQVTFTNTLRNNAGTTVATNNTPIGIEVTNMDVTLD